MQLQLNHPLVYWIALQAAQPALDALRGGLQDSGDYVQQVCRHAVRALTQEKP